MANRYLAFEIQETNPLASILVVSVDPALVTALYREVVEYYQQTIHTPGFPPGLVPLSYVERNYRTSLFTHVQNFMLSFCVTNFVARELRNRGIIMLSAPALLDSAIELTGPSTFRFSCTTLSLAVPSDWRHAAFRAPPRKNYRDLDNQVVAFLAEEEEMAAVDCVIEPHDWIGFSAQLIPGKTHMLPEVKPLLPDIPFVLWMRLGNEEADSEAQSLFFKRKKRDMLISSARFLQDYFRAQYDKQYTFALEIIHHSPHALFCLDLFKKQFKLKSIKDVHRKLIEVFSFRHDISQRRETIETAFKALFKTTPFSVPAQLVTHEKQKLIDLIHISPDYYVYKSQQDFADKVNLLAHKQIKEKAIIDAIAYAERIEIGEQDILHYLNLMKRPRTKEFLYFTLPETRINEREMPISHEELYQACLREKTLNYVIHTLARYSS